MSISDSYNLQVSAASLAERSRIEKAALLATKALAASLFVALCAHIAIPLPFTPVPFTLQPFAVLLTGMLLGPSVGFAALALYLCEGAAGLPVFTPMGLPGIGRLVGPTAGYLFSYPVAAAIAGIVPGAWRVRHQFAAHVAASTVAMLTIYTCGALWFSHVLHASFISILGATVIPFAASDAVKVCAAAGIASALKLHGTRA